MDLVSSRFRIYELLFRQSLFQYAQPAAAGKMRLSVLILGGRDLAAQAFQAVFWCGQMPKNYQLEITLAAPQIEALRAALFAEMPALQNFPDYAQLHFSELSREFLSEISAKNYNYIILASENSVQNQELQAALAQVPAAVFTLESASPEARARLERYAYNIDFSYTMQADQRARKKPQEDFSKDDYNHDSSFASGVHIPYKLEAVRVLSGCRPEETMETLLRCIDRKDGLYHSLVELEHRRWTAYMVTCGYRIPTPEELSGYAYRDGHDHRNKPKKLHPLLYDGDAQGGGLARFPWLWKEIADAALCSVADIRAHLAGRPEETLTDLDCISLALHAIAQKRAQPVCENQAAYFSFLENLRDSRDFKSFENLQKSVEKLCNDEENSIILYERALAEAMDTQPARTMPAVAQALQTIRDAFSPVIVRNRRTDAIAIDAMMIDMLPFYIWYGARYRTFLTFSRGVPTEDVMLPTLLMPERAVLIGDITDQYRRTVDRYFAQRSGLPAGSSLPCNTAAEYVQLGPMPLEHRISFFAELLGRYADPVVDVGGCDTETAMALAIAAHDLDVPVLRYVPARGIVNLMNPMPINSGIQNKSLSVEEFVGLTGGEYENVYQNVSNFQEYNAVRRLFQAYAAHWPMLAEFFARVSKGQAIRFSPQDSEIKFFSASFPQTVFRTCGLGATLSLLCQYGLIGSYRDQENADGSHGVTFSYVDPALAEVLGRFTAEDCLDLRLKFTPMQFESKKPILSLVSTCVEQVPLTAGTEPEGNTNIKRNFLEALQQAQLISGLAWDQDRVSFRFKNERIQKLLKSEGKIFELILYYQIRQLGLYDDVQTGVEIAWERNRKTAGQLFLETLSQSPGLGYGHFRGCLEEFLKSRATEDSDVVPTNEIDVVMMRGMLPVFVSCKARNLSSRNSREKARQWLLEISNLSSHFHAQPVLVVLHDLDRPEAAALLSRARRMGVSLLGTETIFQPQQFRAAFRAIYAGGVVCGSSISGTADEKAVQ